MSSFFPMHSLLFISPCISHSLHTFLRMVRYLAEEPPESKIFAHSRWNQRQISYGYADYRTVKSKWRWLLNEGTETFPETDPDYIFRSAAHQCTPSKYEDYEKHRRGTQNCSQYGWSDPTPTHPNGVNDRSGMYVRQNLYPKNIPTIPRRAHYENKDLPWIVQAHTFNMAGKLPQDIATARFMFPVGTPPGEYVMHWYYAGYANCIDIAVMPPDVVVPDTSFAKWGITTPGSFEYGRIDHCLYGGGIVRSMNFPPITEKYCPYGANRQGCSVNFNQALPSGACATSISDVRQCFVVPPHGATNRLGETRAEAIAACTARCTATGSKGNFESNEQKCAGVNVVPLDIPDVITFKKQSSSRSTTIPFGISNCTSSHYKLYSDYILSGRTYNERHDLFHSLTHSFPFAFPFLFFLLTPPLTTLKVTRAALDKSRTTALGAASATQ